MRKARDYATHVYRIAALDVPIATKMCMLVYCCRPSAMLNHYARVVQAAVARGAASIADEGFVRALAIATNTDEALLRPGLPLAAREQMLNSVHMSGTGCVAIADGLESSYLGSFLLLKS